MKLHEQVRLNALRTAAAREELMRFRAYLAGPKFQGTDPRDGLPNSYIATHEVEARLRELDDLLCGVSDDLLWQEADQNR
jgi:hypothetical protein